MTHEYEFEVDSDGGRFCEEIVEVMVNHFGITRDEAVERINRHWRGQKILGEDVIYHEDAEYWAKTIFYGKDSLWWLEEDDLAPRP